MKSKPQHSLTDISGLTTSLLSTLDESLFFSYLGQHINNQTEIIDSVKIYIIQENSDVRLVSQNGKPAKKQTVLEQGVGPAGHVIRTKKPYFSNNTERDPLFQEEAKAGVRAELALPILHEGIVIATLHLQITKGEGEFSKDHINELLELIAGIKKPLSNIKMYLQAKFLNESLLRKIKSKEKEIEQSKGGVTIADTYKIKDQEVVSHSDVMKRVLTLSDRVSQSNVNVFIKGEKGAGKQMIARRIHCRSDRSGKSFVSIDCTTYSENVLESQIFGEESLEGQGLKNGLLEAANGGTLFINSIDRLKPALQSKLMRFITDGMVFRVNGSMPYKSDVRIIVATFKNIEEQIENGEFREDLYYALNTMSLKVPSLKEREADIETLANHFLNLGKSREDQKSLSPCVLKALKEYHWPGNVRELHNVMERAYILSDGMVVERDHLSESVHKVREAVEEPQESEVFTFTEMTLGELEKKHICITLDHLKGNKTKTAKTLGITVKTLYNKLHSYGMIANKEA